MVSVISDKPLEGAQRSLADLLMGFPDGVRSAAVVLMMDSGDTDTVYSNMCVADKMLAVGMIQADITHDIIEANYPELAEDFEEDEEDD